MKLHGLEAEFSSIVSCVSLYNRLSVCRLSLLLCTGPLLFLNLKEKKHQHNLNLIGLEDKDYLGAVISPSCLFRSAILLGNLLKYILDIFFFTENAPSLFFL